MTTKSQAKRMAAQKHDRADELATACPAIFDIPKDDACATAIRSWTDQHKGELLVDREYDRIASGD